MRARALTRATCGGCYSPRAARVGRGQHNEWAGGDRRGFMWMMWILRMAALAQAAAVGFCAKRVHTAGLRGAEACCKQGMRGP
ncbi:hypothetical protein GGX14DRAFT_485488 [Mycena pura]|uniref:Uncharacterized protein n=1 Tax=Mycena pura TaxID=153505 RepID=A0AAD6UK84_9AGAR|nr:hypothetical protein GGX14DRAFT_485488 [Mycena pura]